MKKIKNKEQKTITYAYDDFFKVDIVEIADTFEAWLYRDTMGIKMLMYGVCKEHIALNSFISLIENNIEDYIEMYDVQYR